MLSYACRCAACVEEIVKEGYNWSVRATTPLPRVTLCALSKWHMLVGYIFSFRCTTPPPAIPLRPSSPLTSPPDCTKPPHARTPSSRAEAETFCHPAPTPNSTKCRAGLEDFCRKDRSSPSLCRECVEEHAQALRELSCTTTEEAQFCTSPKPGPAPVDKCEVELREDCENDRANITLCRKCIELHADPLKAAGCTEDVEVKFCEHTPVPPPAPPTAKCVAALAEYCEPDKHNETLCVRCCEDHRNQTRDAGCTWSAYEFFCKVAPRPRPPGPAPPTPPRVCPAKLEALCGEERKNETRYVKARRPNISKQAPSWKNPILFPPMFDAQLYKSNLTQSWPVRCVHCIEENIAALKAADCTETEEHEFCKPHPAPKESCADAFYALCPRSSWKSNATKCMHCAEEHEEALKAKDCTIAEIDTLCHVAPPPAPGPRGCERALAEECEKDRRNATLCAGCIVNHKEILGKAGCTAIEEEEFCKKTPPPPESHTCGRELVELCDKARKNATACAACEVKNEAALAAAKCTYAEKEEFCHPAPLKPTCENELFELCDADRKNLTKCHACLASHAATFKKVRRSILKTQRAHIYFLCRRTDACLCF